MQTGPFFAMGIVFSFPMCSYLLVGKIWISVKLNHPIGTYPAFLVLLVHDKKYRVNQK